MNDIDHKKFWRSHYTAEDTPWDIGYASPPITEYFDNLVDKSPKILIPGAGNAHEAVWLWQHGFKNVWVVDLVQEPLDKLVSKLPDFPPEQLICGDFFEISDQYDIVVEQTFFCALPPAMRADYVSKMKTVLKPKGYLVGVLFNFPLSKDGPPFGGSVEEYRKLFSKHLDIQILEPCYNSIKPRSGNELFVKFQQISR